MLIEFSIENYRSIKDKVTFSLLASSDTSLEANIFHPETLKKDDDLLRSAAIYGANASGKSNVIKALSTLQRLVLTSIKYQSGDTLPYEPFKLDENCLRKPTRFEIVFIYKKIQYTYTVAFNSEKIVEESLTYCPKYKEFTIFSRSDNNIPRFLKKDTKIQQLIYDRTLKNVLYLSNSAQQNYEKTIDVYDWFKNDFVVLRSADPNAFIDNTVKMLNESNELKRCILKALAEADLGINDVTASSTLFTYEQLRNHNTKAGQAIFRGDKVEIIEIMTLHKANKSKGDTGAIFDYFSEESDGTMRVFNLIGYFIDALNSGKTLIIDELDIRLHPLLCEYLIKLFYNHSRNKNNAQLIFSTHNINLFDKKIFRRDQIWFTEKNPDNGSSDLYSLTEFSPRNDKNILKGYLAGRYGALPFIDNWGDPEW
jgi:AAA15 family ATPase/GTPase